MSLSGSRQINTLIHPEHRYAIMADHSNGTRDGVALPDLEVDLGEGFLRFD